MGQQQTRPAPKDRLSEVSEETPTSSPPSKFLYNAAPKELLSSLLHTISLASNRHHQRYGRFVAKDTARLEELLLNCMRLPTLAVGESHRISDLPVVTAIGGNLQHRGRAIYLHIVQFPDGKTRYYIGQAYNLSYRVNAQHRNFRYRRDNVSFHAYAVDRSSKDTFVVLATLTQPTERPDLVMNILEMWCCLIFRSLPALTVEEWLGPRETADSRPSADTAGQVTRKNDEDIIPSLNIALPLDTGDEMASKAAFEYLREADDSLAREYYWDMKRGRLRPKPAPQIVKIVNRPPAESIAMVIVGGIFGFAIGVLLFGRSSSTIPRSAGLARSVLSKS